MRACPCDSCPVWNAKTLVCREEWVDRFNVRGDVCPPAVALTKAIKKGVPRVSRGKMWVGDDVPAVAKSLAVTIPDMDVPAEVTGVIQKPQAPEPQDEVVQAKPEVAVEAAALPAVAKKKIKVKKTVQEDAPKPGTVEEFLWLKEKAVKAGYELIQVICSSCNGLIDTTPDSPSFGQKVTGYSRGDGDRYIYPVWSLRPGLADNMRPPHSRKLAIRDEVGRMRCWSCGAKNKESWAQ